MKTIVHWQARNGRAACTQRGAVARELRYVTCAMCLAAYDHATTLAADDSTHIDRGGRPACVAKPDETPPGNERLTLYPEFADCKACHRVANKALKADEAGLRRDALNSHAPQRILWRT